ncbi:MAG: hypothetical protein ABUT39_24870 [Acidobacteriota bacterium]
MPYRPYLRQGPLALLFAAALLASRAEAISTPRLSSDLPWGDRVSRDLSLQVAVEPLDRELGGPFRERDRVAFRFRVSEVGSDDPLPGLRPAAWMAPLRTGETVDPGACLAGGPRLALREEAGGTYEAVARLGRPGRYEVAFFLGSPRLVHCFEVEVLPAG